MLSNTSTERLCRPFSPIAEYTLRISDSVALRIYSSTKPHNMKIAYLQKGLVLVNNGAEVIGEGTGFGVPILKYLDETYFSTSSTLQLSKQDKRTIIQKEFHMDATARDTFKTVKLQNRKARTIIDHLSTMWQKNKHFRSLTLKNLFLRFGVHASFVKSPSRGRVIATYTLQDKQIQVTMDFRFLEKTNLSKIFVMNEQSCLFFRVYSDSNGVRLADENIGAWDWVRAQWAKITDSQSRVGFKLNNARNGILRRGREYIADSMDWVGLDYEVNSNNDLFKYEIQIVED